MQPNALCSQPDAERQQVHATIRRVHATQQHQQKSNAMRNCECALPFVLVHDTFNSRDFCIYRKSCGFHSNDASWLMLFPKSWASLIRRWHSFRKVYVSSRIWVGVTGRRHRRQRNHFTSRYRIVTSIRGAAAIMIVILLLLLLLYDLIYFQHEKHK